MYKINIKNIIMFSFIIKILYNKSVFGELKTRHYNDKFSIN